MRMFSVIRILSLVFMALPLVGTAMQAQVRERLLINKAWKFAYGHANDVARDFNVGTRYFSYLAKAGYGDGAAAADFDDRSWRPLDLPHDWAVEQDFSPQASHSHGYKTVGPGFPETSVGWYRKSFSLSETDAGKRIFLEFDGVYRDARVWVNGFYCGQESSGYTSFAFDVSEYLNFGGDNVIAVRVDASMEEGWFYEGAGIYRHVWLTKVAPLHVPQYGTFVTSSVGEQQAALTARVQVHNKGLEAADFELVNVVLDPRGLEVARKSAGSFRLAPMERKTYTDSLMVYEPLFWDLDHPHLYTLESRILQKGHLVDVYPTRFGIRTIEWTADKGFFLNGRQLKIKGTNNHQNHAGVGTAIPDALQVWRLKQLKAMGSNTYRTAHYPPSPALLNAADSLGVLILSENRLMGTTEQNMDYLRRLILRDRNHPSVVLWSIGNEEWALESNHRGARMAEIMQAYARQFDTTRPFNAAVSGSWGQGISSVIEVMGYNYLRNGDTDAHHVRFPWQPALGTEEGSTNTTRGVYFDDPERQYLAAYDRDTPTGFFAIQHGWKHYASRDYLAGMVIWTGFDYRGESTPFTYPSVLSYFGMFDLCGFPKDNVYYLKSWWGREDVLHILPHWNWKGREGEPMDVWVYSNMDEVELFLNNQSLGRKVMQVNGHLSWEVPYKAGILKAEGYKAGQRKMTRVVETTGQPQQVHLQANRSRIKADGRDVAVVEVALKDSKGRNVPDANVLVSFDVDGPARIIGVGNGDPTSHESDRFLPAYFRVVPENWKEHKAEGLDLVAAAGVDFDDSSWGPAFREGGLPPGSVAEARLVRGRFELTREQLEGEITWMFRSIGTGQSVYLNGQLLERGLNDESARHAFRLPAEHLRVGSNSLVVVFHPFVKKHEWDEPNENPGEIQVILPAAQWQRRTFNGLAQVLLQSTGEPGEVVLTGKAEGLRAFELKLETR